MILHNFVKQCKKCDFWLKKGERLHNVLGDGPTKWPIATKKLSKHLCFGMHHN